MTEQAPDHYAMIAQPEVAEQGRSPHVYMELGEATANALVISANHELLASKHLVSPQAAMLELTNFRNQKGVSLGKLNKEVADPAAVLTTVDTMAHPSEEQRQTASEAALALLRSGGLSVPTPPVPAGSVGKEAFDKTQRDRRMFGPGGRGSAQEESYMSQLFSGAANPEIIDRVATDLANKRILNLGGGNARLTEELAQHGVANTEVINIEPYPSDEALSGEGFDHIIDHNPADADFFDKTEMPEHAVDEIWAVFSVPAYLGTSQEVTNLFDNVKRAIRPGGVIRISHLGVAESDGGDSVMDRSTAIVHSLERAKQEGYLVEVVTSHNGTRTLIMTAPESTQAA